MSLLNDLRYALRGFRRSPMLVAAALLSMTLGIGANTAIFSLLHQILLRALPVQNPAELVILKRNGENFGRTWDDGTHTSFSYPMFQDTATETKVFSGVFARFAAPITVTYNGSTERALTEMVTGDYFRVLGVKAAIGRTLLADDDRQRGASPVAVLSDNAFRNRYGGNPAILNQKVLINGHPFTVVGVAQPGFSGFQAGVNADVFVPMAMVEQVASEWKDLSDRQSHWLQIVARLQPGVSRDQAQAAMATRYKAILAEESKTVKLRSERSRQSFLGKTLTLLDGGRGHSPMRQEMSTPLLALMGMVGLVLLIACANVANLLLSRAAGREREIAIRLSIGASRSRLVAQLLTESLALSVTGGVLGLALAAWLSKALLAMLPMSEYTSTFQGGRQRHGTGLHRGSGHRHRAAVRPGAGDPIHASRPRHVAQGSGHGHYRRIQPRAVAQSFGGRPGGAVAGAVDRRRTVRPQPVQPAFHRDRTAHRPCDDLQHRSLAEQLYRPAGIPDLRPHPAIAALDSRRAPGLDVGHAPARRQLYGHGLEGARGTSRRKAKAQGPASTSPDRDTCQPSDCR